MPPKHNRSFLITLSLLLLTACNQTPVPRPRGFFRIDLPLSKPVLFDKGYPYSFTYQDYGTPFIKDSLREKRYWVDIRYPQFNGTLHLSYKKVDNNLPNLIEDAHNLVMKHIPKSSGIDEVRYENRQNKVYGIGFYINGTEAASPYQFFVTDSSHHFLRGALYFNALPNNDSLAPVIKFLKKDIEALIASISWHPPH